MKQTQDLDKKLQETERALRETQENFQFIVENARDFILKFDLDGNLLFANHAYLEKDVYKRQVHGLRLQRRWRRRLPHHRLAPRAAHRAAHKQLRTL